MASTALQFPDQDAHRRWLAEQAGLPVGFRVGSHSFDFVPIEVGKPARMTASVVVADEPCEAFAACFTRNAFPGAPVLIGRQRLHEGALQAVLINNKISNVCAPDGVATAQACCAAVGAALDIPAERVLPSSTGVIGWRLPLTELQQAIPYAVAAGQRESILPLATGIMTTDGWPKVRCATLPGGGRLVGVAKGAGMIEPNLATMLVFLFTDVAIARDELRRSLQQAVDRSFNRISIDSDQSTSDTVLAMASARLPAVDDQVFNNALERVCGDLAEDVVRNGEGVHHVIRCRVSGAPTELIARSVGKAVINSPLLQCAICGNDPNVGRLLMAVGKYLGNDHPGLDTSHTRIAIAGETVFEHGSFTLDTARETRLSRALQAAEMYASVAPDDQGVFAPPIAYPPHEHCVDIAIDLGLANGKAAVLGADRTHEYISENADYRS